MVLIVHARDIDSLRVSGVGCVCGSYRIHTVRSTYEYDDYVKIVWFQLHKFFMRRANKLFAYKRTLARHRIDSTKDISPA